MMESSSCAFTHGLMMDTPLQLRDIAWRAENLFGDKEIVTRTETGYHRYTYVDCMVRARRLASAMIQLGVGPGERVGTFAWNDYRHYEAYFAVPCMGSVLHTINIRLQVEQIASIVNHADDRVLLVAPDLLPTIEAVRDLIPGVKAFVVLGDFIPDTTLGSVYAYESLLEQAEDNYQFPSLDETAALGLCYTSATTGDPKGVLYSHRSTWLHSMAIGLADTYAIRENMTICPISPMFHALSWDVPYAAAMHGAKLVLPGPHPGPADLLELLSRERVTAACAAVTVGIQMRDTLLASRGDYNLDAFKVFLLGGQAPPRAIMEWYQDELGVYVPQAWGSTETNPIVCWDFLKSKFDDADTDLHYEMRSKQGIPMPGIEVRAVDEDGNLVPWDGKTVGELQVRGPWVCSAYFNDVKRSMESFTDGWFRIGDMGTIDADGYVRLVDRTKDLIKSGGEWISSVDLENALMGHPAVSEAAVVAIPDEKWLERPLALVVPVTPDNPPSSDDLESHLRTKVAKWWIPDRFVMVDAIPKTAIGKFDKKLMREQFS